VITETSREIQKFRQFVFPEIHLVSSVHNFGINEIRGKIGIAFEEKMKP